MLKLRFGSTITAARYFPATGYVRAQSKTKNPRKELKFPSFIFHVLIISNHHCETVMALLGVYKRLMYLYFEALRLPLQPFLESEVKKVIGPPCHVMN